MVKVEQGAIVKMNLDPRQGHEQKGYRPYVLLSNPIVNRYSNIAIFAPISNTERSFPLYVPVRGTKQITGKVLLDQLITVDYNERGYRYVETVEDEFLEELLLKARLIFTR